jgi:hypothetical protein
LIKGDGWLLELLSKFSKHSSSTQLYRTVYTMLCSSSVVSLLALASIASAAPSGSIEKRAPTVYLAGDSTMATAKGAAGTLQGRLSGLQDYNGI